MVKNLYHPYVVTIIDIGSKVYTNSFKTYDIVQEQTAVAFK